jgi:hypothetical protein
MKKRKTAVSVNTLQNLIKLPVPPPHTETTPFPQSSASSQAWDEGEAFCKKQFVYP